MNSDALRLVELISSRICHDLINPVAAVGQGAELFQDIAPDTAPDITSLVTTSAGRATRRIQFLRVALGYAGGREEWPGRELRQPLEGIVEDGREILWSPDADDAVFTSAEAKLFLCTGMMALESLLRGGQTTLLITGASPVAWSFVAKGKDARMHAGSLTALTTDMPCSEIDARTSLHFLVAEIARNSGRTIDVQSGQDTVVLSVA